MINKSEQKEEINENIENKVEETFLGDIKINHSVVANIARLAALEVDGVYAVGGGFVEGLTEIFSKKDTERGVRVSENEVGDYVIELRVTLLFGRELAKLGSMIQQNVISQVSKMTLKNVDRVDVIIDGVKDASNQRESSEAPNNNTNS